MVKKGLTMSDMKRSFEDGIDGENEEEEFENVIDELELDEI